MKEWLKKHWQPREWIKNYWQPIIAWLVVLFVIIPIILGIIDFFYDLQHLLFGWDWSALWGMAWRLGFMYVFYFGVCICGPIFFLVFLTKFLLNQKDFGSGLSEDKTDLDKISLKGCELQTEDFFPGLSPKLREKIQQRQ